MRRLPFSVLLGALMLPALGARAAGADLTPEKLLPVHEDKDAYAPDVEFGGGLYLAAWQAGRMGEGALVGCRVGKDGNALDAQPFVISDAEEDQEKPCVAFGKKGFLVVWQDLRNNKDYDVYAARVTGEGKVLDANGILVSGSAHNQCNPSVAYDGRTFVVAWQDFRNGSCYQIYCARVSEDGRVIDPQGTLLTPKGDFRFMTAVASRGDGRSLVVWGNTAQGGIQKTEAERYEGGAFVQDGKKVPPRVTRPWSRSRTESKHGLKRGPVYVSLAAGPTTWLQCWRNYRPFGRAGAQLDCSGRVLDKDGQRTAKDPITLHGGLHFCMDPDAVWDGKSYVAVWHDQTSNENRYNTRGEIFDQVYASRLDEKGKALLPEPGKPYPVSGSFQSPARRAKIATDGTGGNLIVYEKHPATADVPIRIAFRLLRAK